MTHIEHPFDKLKMDGDFKVGKTEFVPYDNNFWPSYPVNTPEPIKVNPETFKKLLETQEEKVNNKKDMVNHPDHYTKGGIECLDAIKASMTQEEFEGYLKGNVEKYLWRYKQKGKPVEDLDKADFYLTRLRKEVKTNNTTKD